MKSETRLGRSTVIFLLPCAGLPTSLHWSSYLPVALYILCSYFRCSQSHTHCNTSTIKDFVFCQQPAASVTYPGVCELHTFISQVQSSSHDAAAVSGSKPHQDNWEQTKNCNTPSNLAFLPHTNITSPWPHLVGQVPVEEDGGDGACAEHQESCQNQTEVDPSATATRKVGHPHQLRRCTHALLTFCFIFHSRLQKKKKTENSVCLLFYKEMQSMTIHC